MNYRTALISFAAIAAATVSIATAQTAAPATLGTDAVHGMAKDSMKSENMQNMSPESMQGGGMRMMATMMGKDSARSCASSNKKIGANSVLRKKMQGIMQDAMGGNM